MAAELIITPEVEQDVVEAYAWYEDRKIGLGEEFLACVDACIQAILRTYQYAVDTGSPHTCVDACIQAILRTGEMYASIHENYRRSLDGGVILCIYDRNS